jgi:flagellar biosynthetic protein FlhB
MSERSEAPTPRRLEEARERGQVPRSVELNAAVALLAAAWLIQGPGASLWTNGSILVLEAIDGMNVGEISAGWLTRTMVNDFLLVIVPMAEIILGLMVIGVVVTVAQTGFLWASKRPGFDFSRVNPLTGIKRLLSSQGLVELLKAMFKLVIVGWTAYSYLQANASKMLDLMSMDLQAGLIEWMGLAVSLMFRIGITYLVLAIADYAYQRWQYIRGLKMTKKEVFDDFKRSEGDPMLRGRIRQQQRRMARQRMMSKVPQADVVITNPTHLAIAIKYDVSSMKAPVVLAKGSYFLAEKVIDLAKAKNVPVVQNIPLARAIYKVVEVDQEIPPDFYLAMAEVLAYVYRIKGQSVAQALN